MAVTLEKEKTEKIMKTQEMYLNPINTKIIIVSIINSCKRYNQSIQTNLLSVKLEKFTPRPAQTVIIANIIFHPKT